MTLSILRHGIAVEPGDPDYPNDSDRPLTDKGRKKLAKVLQAMEAMDLSFDLVLSSPFVRARQTAEIVAKGLGIVDYLELTENLIPGADANKLIELVKSHERAPENVLLVGHEPFLSGLISTLVSGSANFDVVLKKGGLCQLNLESLQHGRCAALDWLLTPRQMTFIAGGS